MEQFSQFITHHWQLCLAWVLVLFFIVINEFFTRKHRAKSISPSAAVLMMNHEGATVIDLREQEAYRAGHIIDAIQASAEDFKQERMGKYKEKPLILVCSRGIQSVELATKLRQQGFTQVVSLAGGMTAWQEASLPIVKKKK